MKIADFDFRIVKKKRENGHYNICNNEQCICNTPFIYGNEAFCRLSEFIDTDTEIELWSGLTDSEGNKIYDGDIVECLYDKVLCVVRNANGRFELNKYGYGDTYYGYLGLELYKQGLKVVGNIHENADLLNKRKE